MKYFYYSSKQIYAPGWIVTDTKAKHSDLCGKGIRGFWLAIRVWLWYLGLPARLAFHKKNVARQEKPSGNDVGVESRYIKNVYHKDRTTK